MTSIFLLSGGAAQGLVTQIQPRFKTLFRRDIAGTFGAVGIMKDSLLAGAPCDVVILTDALVAQLTSSGKLLAGSAKNLGVVKTGVAVKAGKTHIDVSTPHALVAALKAARRIYFPDPVKATAGIHVMKVIKALGLQDELAGRLRPFPNGAAAMKAMADSNEAGLLGITQITEILYAEGIDLAASLPTEFELATVYTAAVCTLSTEPQAARAFIEMLAGENTAEVRSACGFEI